jgi:hypothetical protein
MTMMTCSVHGLAVVQVAFWGMVTENVCDPLCMVCALDPGGKPSARMGWVGDQTGLLRMGGVQLVPAWACGSARELSVCVELAP